LNAQFPKQSKYSAANKLNIAKQALPGRPNAKPEHQAQPSTVLLLQFNIYSKMQKLGARQYSTSTFRRDERAWPWKRRLSSTTIHVLEEISAEEDGEREL
jgi:hypothetical protein